MPQRREADLVRQILAELGAEPGVSLWRNNVGVATHLGRDGQQMRVAYGVGGPGAPDLLCEVGVPADVPVFTAVLWVETKAPDGRLRPDQRAWHEAARRRGAVVCVARSVEDVRRAIEGMRVRVQGDAR